MADLIATKALKYATRRLLPGDDFETKNERDARILIGIGKAKLATDPKPVASVEPEDEMKALRDLYHAKLGKRPFNGWDAETLREKIADASA